MGNAGIEGKTGDTALAFLRADEDIADLRAVAVGDDDLRAAPEKRNEVAQSLGGVFELLGNGPRLSGAGNGIAAKGDDESVTHGRAALPDLAKRGPNGKRSSRQRDRKSTRLNSSHL